MNENEKLQVIRFLDLLDDFVQQSLKDFEGTQRIDPSFLSLMDFLKRYSKLRRQAVTNLSSQKLFSAQSEPGSPDASKKDLLVVNQNHLKEFLLNGVSTAATPSSSGPFNAGTTPEELSYGRELLWYFILDPDLKKGKRS